MVSTFEGSPTKPRSTRLDVDLVDRVRRLAGDDHVAVLAAKADGVAAFRVDEADDLLVDRAGEHHFDDLDRGLVGDAQAVRKLAT